MGKDIDSRIIRAVPYWSLWSYCEGCDCFGVGVGVCCVLCGEGLSLGGSIGANTGKSMCKV